eukprot:TRINITY_DN225_c0_g1_i4.p1 TRINITY_DN225_c0_g1~~TRINITY_DN225_c0_g1_i4.p1  ORF type:complete len:624 (+),score=142.78 TRINITY_DN225_c0_g1_i4:159-1874(+)
MKWCLNTGWYRHCLEKMYQEETKTNTSESLTQENVYSNANMKINMQDGYIRITNNTKRRDLRKVKMKRMYDDENKNIVRKRNYRSNENGKTKKVRSKDYKKGERRGTINRETQKETNNRSVNTKKIKENNGGEQKKEKSKEKEISAKKRDMSKRKAALVDAIRKAKAVKMTDDAPANDSNDNNNNNQAEGGMMNIRANMQIICKKREATDGTCNMVTMGFIQIEYDRGSAQNQIIRIKTQRLAKIEYEEVVEGANYLIIKIDNKDVEELTKRTKGEDKYQTCYIPHNMTMWHVKTIINTEHKAEEIARAVKTQPAETTTPVGYNVIPMKKSTNKAILIMSYVRPEGWTNLKTTNFITINEESYQIAPDLTTIPQPHVQIYTKQKNTSFNRTAWLNWIVDNTCLTKEQAIMTTALTPAYNNSSMFTSAVITFEDESNINELVTKKTGPIGKPPAQVFIEKPGEGWNYFECKYSDPEPEEIPSLIATINKALQQIKAEQEAQRIIIDALVEQILENDSSEDEESDDEEDEGGDKNQGNGHDDKADKQEKNKEVPKTKAAASDDMEMEIQANGD